jgi:hypothetical protein
MGTVVLPAFMFDQGYFLFLQDVQGNPLVKACNCLYTLKNPRTEKATANKAEL